MALIEIAHAEDAARSACPTSPNVSGSARGEPHGSRWSSSAKGLVKRRRDSDDARSTRIAATDAGRERLLEPTPAYLSTIRGHAFEGLGERDVKQLARILERIKRAAGIHTDGVHTPAIDANAGVSSQPHSAPALDDEQKDAQARAWLLLLAGWPSGSASDS